MISRVDSLATRLIPILLVTLLPLGRAQPDETGNSRKSGVEQATAAGAPARFTFGWAAPGVAAAVAVPLPGKLLPEQVVDVKLTEEVALLGFSSHHDSRFITLYLAPAPGSADVTFEDVRIELASGSLVPQRVGPVRLVTADTAGGPLSFERSSAAPAAGLFLVAALRNTAAAPLLIRSVEYLPTDLPVGTLLFATAADPMKPLAALELEFSPARQRHGETRTGAAAGMVAGFERLQADDARVVVPPGEVLILAWTHESLPAGQAHDSYRLQPVITYTTSGTDDRSLRLGLPVTLRAP